MDLPRPLGEQHESQAAHKKKTEFNPVQITGDVTDSARVCDLARPAVVRPFFQQHIYLEGFPNFISQNRTTVSRLTPTGSGKTISAEQAMLHLFNTAPDMKVIYIAPLKAIVRERMNDWKNGLVSKLGKKMVEMTGDYTPDMMALMSADIIISTPEKWDGISRNWHTRSYVTKVGLMILDEIHLLGADRGPILEVIVSRMRYISSQTEQPIRFVGLSTALANAQNLADWLGVEDIGLFNFKPSVRPVPLEGYPGKFYCPRMNSMNKPTYAAICTHSPTKPVLIFVSSRRQTRLTALDLIQFAAADEHPVQFLAMPEEALQMVLSQVTDQNLRHTLQFGIGLHHAGLNDKDRSLVEELFANNKIQVLVCTSTLAWGVNLPAHLVIIKLSVATVQK
ncbi:DExH-box ATP-dependent RNA helicase DExH14 isoform X2 [Tanacetum coccineum]